LALSSGLSGPTTPRIRRYSSYGERVSDPIYDPDVWWKAGFLCPLITLVVWCGVAIAGRSPSLWLLIPIVGAWSVHIAAQANWFRRYRHRLVRLGVSDVPPPRGAVPTDDGPVLERLFAAANAREYAAAIECFSPDYALELPGRSIDRARRVVLFRRVVDVLPDVRWRVEDMVAQPEPPGTIWVRIRQEGRSRLRRRLVVEYWERYVVDAGGRITEGGDGHIISVS
jgi:hypothetical protein